MKSWAPSCSHTLAGRQRFFGIDPAKDRLRPFLFINVEKKHGRTRQGICRCFERCSRGTSISTEAARLPNPGAASGMAGGRSPNACRLVHSLPALFLLRACQETQGTAPIRRPGAATPRRGCSNVSTYRAAVRARHAVLGKRRNDNCQRSW